MNKYWTYANLGGKWENEMFETKEQAIEQAQSEFEDNFLIGQLMATEDDLVFAVRNIEEIEVGVYV